MSSVNKVILVGNVGTEPEMRYTADGTAVVNLSLATSKKIKGQDDTQWHRLVFFKHLAEIVAKYVTKGSKIYVEGEIKTKKYKDKDGVDKYVTDIICRDMQMLDSKSENNSSVKPTNTSKVVSDLDDQDIPF